MRIKLIISLLLLLAMIEPTIAASSANNSLKDAPISVDADSLEIMQNQNKAVFSGNVIATQQDMVLKSDKMIIYYQQQAKGAEQEKSPLGALERIEVLGNVKMNTPTESASSERGLYDAMREKIFLYGNVVLRKDGNVLNGSALQYDMKTGSSIVNGGVDGSMGASGAKSGRVRGIFAPTTKD
jgi:lipopolysaccharide export system protein LptA